MPKGAVHKTVIVPPFLWRYGQSERVGAIKNRVSIGERKRAVILGSFLFGDDLDPTSSRASEFRCIRVLIDFDFLDGRWRDAGIFLFHPIDNNRYSSRRGCGLVQEIRYGCDIILIEDRKFLEH